jgi:hypothetical protein
LDDAAEMGFLFVSVSLITLGCIVLGRLNVRFDIGLVADDFWSLLLSVRETWHSFWRVSKQVQGGGVCFLVIVVVVADDL